MEAGIVDYMRSKGQNKGNGHGNGGENGCGKWKKLECLEFSRISWRIRIKVYSKTSEVLRHSVWHGNTHKRKGKSASLALTKKGGSPWDAGDI